jgi:hypothetical protein
MGKCQGLASVCAVTYFEESPLRVIRKKVVNNDLPQGAGRHSRGGHHQTVGTA